MIDYKERQKIVWQNMFYSIQRIDLLIISVSGAGIYLCLESLKFMYSNKLPVNYSLKVAAGLFVLSIVANFISQFLSYHSNMNDYLYCVENQKEVQDDESQRKAIIYDDKSERFDKQNTYFNYISAGLMFIGLAVCFLYFVMTF